MGARSTVMGVVFAGGPARGAALMAIRPLGDRARVRGAVA